jgi:hypothetical protein
MTRLCQSVLKLVLFVPVLWVGGTLAVAEEQAPSGKVFIETTSIAAGVGVEWGEGILTFNGKKYLFSLQGLEVVGVGYAKVTTEGEVYNLKQLSDFEGVYAAAEVGAAAGSGPATTTMKNPNGVVLRLHAVQEGVKLTLAAEGVNIELKE